MSHRKEPKEGRDKCRPGPLGQMSVVWPKEGNKPRENKPTTQKAVITDLHRIIPTSHRTTKDVDIDSILEIKALLVFNLYLDGRIHVESNKKKQCPSQFGIDLLSARVEKYPNFRDGMEAFNKTAVVTGSTGVIGRNIAFGLVDRGFNVIMVCRNTQKCLETKEWIKKQICLKDKGKQARISFDDILICENADLSCKSSISSLSCRIKEKKKDICVLINNAAECPKSRVESEEGIEKQFATNVMGYFWMIESLSDVLEMNSPSMIVNVASYWAGGLDFNDLQFKRRRYDNDSAYRQSKQAVRMLTVSFAQRFREKGISVNSAHPGDANSKLSNDLGFGGHESGEEAARTPLYVATEISRKITGKYFQNMRERQCEFSLDKPALQKLFDYCQNLH